METIYIAYTINEETTKAELDRQVGEAVRTCFEDYNNSNVGAVTFVLFVKNDYMEWLDGDEDTPSAREIFMESKVLQSEELLNTKKKQERLKMEEVIARVLPTELQKKKSK